MVQQKMKGKTICQKLCVKTPCSAGNVFIIIVLNICERGCLKGGLCRFGTFGCLKGGLCRTGGATENGVGSYPQLHSSLYFSSLLLYFCYLLPLFYCTSVQLQERFFSIDVFPYHCTMCLLSSIDTAYLISSKYLQACKAQKFVIIKLKLINYAPELPCDNTKANTLKIYLKKNRCV